MASEQRPEATRRRDRHDDQDRLRQIVDRMADGIVIVGYDGSIRFVNHAAEQLFGRAASVLEGTEFGFPVVAGETTEIDVVRPGGATLTAELRVADTDWNGDAARLVSLRDITDRKRAEEQKALLVTERVARAEAEAASQAKSEFLAMMSHELRTPLNAVIGYADLLELGIAGELNTDQRHQIARIRASGRHLLSLVNEVLDLSKVEAGRLSLSLGVARAGESADAAQSLVHPAAETRAIKFTGRCAGDTEACYVGDEDRVRQILVNVLSNAVKFTEPGGTVSVECGVTSEPDVEARLAPGRYVYIRVADSGIGIPSDRIGVIFDPFVQVESGHTRTNEGSGLGLTISRRLARLMKGDLTVKSVVGDGSVFTLWLPAASAAAASAPRRPARPEPVIPERLHGLSDVGELLIREIEPLLKAFVTRIRIDAVMPVATSLGFAQLVDHVPAFVADVAGSLIAVAESNGQPSALVADGTEIQRVIAERHGAQRARLGWTEAALRREWSILGEEIARTLRRGASGVDARTVMEAVAIAARFVEQVEEHSCRALARAHEERLPSRQLSSA